MDGAERFTREQQYESTHGELKPRHALHRPHFHLHVSLPPQHLEVPFSLGFFPRFGAAAEVKYLLAQRQRANRQGKGGTTWGTYQNIYTGSRGSATY